MGDGTMRDEYPDETQRAAVCSNTWRQAKKVEAAKAEGYDLDAEIFAVGKWNGMTFGRDDLEAIAANFRALSKNHRVPLKLGHSGDEDLRAGQPALGWVEDVWAKDDKLMARFTAVPEMVYNAIKAGHYRTVSIELDIDVSHMGQHYDYVLSGVALLGSEIPAVNTLEDLTAYMGAKEADYTAQRQATFTAIGGEKGDDEPGKGDGDMGMTQEEKAEFDRLKNSVDELKGERDEVKQERDKLKERAEKAEGKVAEMEAKQKKAEFQSLKQNLETRLDALVKAEKITPARRDRALENLKEDDETTHQVAQFTVDTLEETFGKPGAEDKDVPGKGEQGLAGNDGGAPKDEPANAQFSRKVREYQRQHNVDYRQAAAAVGDANPELREAWVNEDLPQ
jgi:hypothetical protein